MKWCEKCKDYVVCSLTEKKPKCFTDRKAETQTISKDYVPDTNVGDMVAQDRRWKYSFAGDTEERLKQAIDDMIRLGPFLGASWWSEVTV